MAYNKVVRFQYVSGGSVQTIDFYGDEVDTVTITKKRKIDIQQLQNRKPIIYFLGDKWRTISIDLYPAKVDVCTNVETLQAITDVMTLLCYYSDGTTVAENISVKIDPNAPSYFYGGDREVKIIRLYLFEASSGNVAVIIPSILPVGT
jgi:hypothetical protein